MKLTTFHFERSFLCKKNPEKNIVSKKVINIFHLFYSQNILQIDTNKQDKQAVSDYI